MFNAFVWKRAPKDVFVGKYVLDIAVASAVVAFDDSAAGIINIMDKIGPHTGHWPPYWTLAPMLDIGPHTGHWPPCWTLAPILDIGPHTGHWPPYWTLAPILDIGPHTGHWPPYWTLAPILDIGPHTGHWPPYWTLAPILDIGPHTGHWPPYWTLAPILDIGPHTGHFSIAASRFADLIRIVADNYKSSEKAMIRMPKRRATQTQVTRIMVLACIDLLFWVVYIYVYILFTCWFIIQFTYHDFSAMMVLYIWATLVD